MNFGRDRFDILRSLSRNDIQVLVGHGCPRMDSKVVFSGKLLRKYVHLDEGDVCSSCSLRSSCVKGYTLTHKEDEARTLDVMRILLTFGFDHVNGAVENKPLMKMKSVKTVVRKLLHEVVRLGTIPIDPNLSPPVIKKPPPKVKQPPPQPKKRVGRDDVEMKRGDWLCHKCDFMNFAKNTVCLKCDAKRPKRQLLPGEWECPKCNFLNYRRNMACFHCEHQRPPDEYTENERQPRHAGPQMRMQMPSKMTEVSNAWNFDFDDNESDGADVAAFEFADSRKLGMDSSSGRSPREVVSRGLEDESDDSYEMPRTRGGRHFSDPDEKKSNTTSDRTLRTRGGRYFSEPDERKSDMHSSRTGFDDFDDEEDDVDSYELDMSNNNRGHEVSRKNFSEIEQTSGSEDFDDGHSANTNWETKNSLSGSEDDNLIDHTNLESSKGAGAWQKTSSRSRRTPFGSDDDIEFNSDSDDEGFNSKQRKGRQQSFGRKGKGEDTDSDLEPFLGSESEDDDYPSGRGKNMRGNNPRILGRTGSDRSREFRSDDRSSGRSSFGDSGNPSSRGSHKSDRGSRSEWRENNRFEPRGRNNQFQNRSRGGHRNERSSRDDGYGGGRGDDGYQRNNSRDTRRNERGSRDDGYGGGRGRGRGDDSFQRTNSRSNYMNERGLRSDGYGGGRGCGRNKASDYRQNGRKDRYTERSRSFDDNDGENRASRRIIER